jgi:hypothetical protein
MLRRNRPRLGGFAFLLFAGASLLFLGAWFALRSIGAPLPGIDAMWPIFPTLVGAAFLLGFALQPRAWGLVLPGTMVLLVGGFFFAFTLGPLDWTDMSRLWPVFPLIVGLSFVAMWLASLFRHWGLLVPALLGISTGVLGLGLTTTPLGEVVGMVGWPVVFLATGASLVLVAMLTFVLRTLRVLGGRA